MNRKQLKISIERELSDNLLPFWREQSPDRVYGGFVAKMSNDGVPNAGAPKGLILNARLLWTFSALYREFAEARDLDLARRAFDFLENCFRDRRNGGYFWRVARDCRALDRLKKVYGQAFCIYALSEYFRATGEATVLRTAAELWELIEKYAHDSNRGGYIEVLSEDWSPSANLRLGDNDMTAAKSMNNHLHIMEAYTNLYRAWPDPAVAGRLRELIRLFGSMMLTPSGHFDLFFDSDWKVRSNSYTYGHDIEGAWLIYDAAEALGEQDLLMQASRWIVRIADCVAAEALDNDGGLAYAGRSGAVIDGGREWWPQAEGILGFWYAYRVTGEEKYAEIAGRLWDFIVRRMADRVHGEWFWRVFPDGSVDAKKPKISEWKDPYHGIRMCLKMLCFLD